MDERECTDDMINFLDIDYGSDRIVIHFNIDDTKKEETTNDNN